MVTFLYLWLSNWIHELNSFDFVRDAFARTMHDTLIDKHIGY
jgi:hypothetical protein